MLANLSVLITYEHFITFGLIAAVPASAFCDIFFNGIEFSDMKLTGIMFICCGFILVLTPSNFISKFRKPIKYNRRFRNIHRHNPSLQVEEADSEL